MGVEDRMLAQDVVHMYRLHLHPHQLQMEMDLQAVRPKLGHQMEQ